MNYKLNVKIQNQLSKNSIDESISIGVSWVKVKIGEIRISKFNVEKFNIFGSFRD